jgi:hypothetical protein
MLLAVNALLYLFALTLAVAVMSPMPAGASRRSRTARATLACGGGLAVVTAIALGYLGLWFESALAGTVAIVIVGVCLCVGLAREPAQAEDEEDEDDEGGGSLYQPLPPEPTKPEGGPPDDLWPDFDRARAEWSRDGDRTPA